MFIELPDLCLDFNRIETARREKGEENFSYF